MFQGWYASLDLPNSPRNLKYLHSPFRQISSTITQIIFVWEALLCYIAKFLTSFSSSKNIVFYLKIVENPPQKASIFLIRFDLTTLINKYCCGAKLLLFSEAFRAKFAKRSLSQISYIFIYFLVWW